MNGDLLYWLAAVLGGVGGCLAGWKFTTWLGLWGPE